MINLHDPEEDRTLAEKYIDINLRILLQICMVASVVFFYVILPILIIKFIINSI